MALGPLRTSALIVDGDGRSVISPGSVAARVLDGDVEPPAEMPAWREEIAAEEDRVREAGDRVPVWNGPRCAVESLDVSRTALRRLR